VPRFADAEREEAEAVSPCGETEAVGGGMEAETAVNSFSVNALWEIEVSPCGEGCGDTLFSRTAVSKWVLS